MKEYKPNWINTIKENQEYTRDMKMKERGFSWEQINEMKLKKDKI